MRELIRKILRETVSIQLRRRMTRGGELDKLINKFRLTSFMKNTPIGGSVEKTIRQVANEIFPNEMSYDTHAEADEDWNGLLKFLYDQYGEELTQYFEKRQENYDNEQNPLEYKYVPVVPTTFSPVPPFANPNVPLKVIGPVVAVFGVRPVLPPENVVTPDVAAVTAAVTNAVVAS